MLQNLPRHIRLGLQAGVLLVLVFLGLLGYAARRAPQMSRDSQRALDAFYLRCQTHNYARAYQLLAPELQDILTEDELAARWRAYEKTNGRIQKWLPAAGGSIHIGGRVCLFPPFVDYTHRVVGQNGSTIANATVVYIRMVPGENGWRVQKLSFTR